ncbi:MAG: flippase-like domain-containing protein [Saprospiraceae bacterium]|nr:flippase-like domain-containing protein [Saprospiraceae bacterium]
MSVRIPKIRIPGWFKICLKIAVSIAIVLLILRKIDERLLFELIRTANPGFILLAICWFIISKLISAIRFSGFLQTQGIMLTVKQNLRFYWLGMYYNLLLPGGVSGDGYKIKVLMDTFNKPFKRLFSILLIDRITGVFALLQICLLMFLWIPQLQGYSYICFPGLILSFVGLWLIFKWFGENLSSILLKTSLQSLGVQGAQTLAALALVFALGQQSQWAGYLILFLISSLIAMVPFTIGGAGARELTFLYGASYLELQSEKAVAIGFLFYLISTAVSLFGMIFSFKRGVLEN